jgi:hypothetical protein
VAQAHTFAALLHVVILWKSDHDRLLIWVQVDVFFHCRQAESGWMGALDFIKV